MSLSIYNITSATNDTTDLGTSPRKRRYGAAVDVSTAGTGSVHATVLRATLSATMTTTKAGEPDIIPTALDAGLQTAPASSGPWRDVAEFKPLGATGTATVSVAGPEAWLRGWVSTRSYVSACTIVAEVSP